MNSSLYEKCTLCPRECGVDRTVARGYCKMPAEPYVARASLHMWEEPPISGTRGSGTVFLSGCSLGCIFCQNTEISRGTDGIPVSAGSIADAMLRLADAGAHNVNFVTPSHYAPTVRDAIIIARSRGLKIPIVYNTSSYDRVETLKSLDGLVDIYLPDFKYYRESTAARYSNAPDYPTVARAAIAEMYRQSGPPVLDGEGIMLRGTIVRILLLPEHVAEAKLILKYLYTAYGDNIYISLMNQYTPMPGMPRPLDRRVSRAEYRELTDYAADLGLRNCFIQEGGTAKESFIPPFSDPAFLKSRI